MVSALDYYNLSLILGGFIALISGIVVYHNNPKRLENISWLLLSISTATWSFGYAAMIASPVKHTALISNWILHGAAILIPLFYFFFILVLTKTLAQYKGWLIFALLLGVIFLILNPTHLFINDVFPKYVFRYAPNAGPLYIYFTVYFFSLVIYGLVILFQSIRKSTGIKLQRLRFVFYSSLAGLSGGASVFFLTFNIDIPPYPLVLFSLYPMIIAYAMLRHHLFDVKIITTELLTFALWMFLLVRVLLGETWQERMIDGSLLALVMFFGILLIRSVLQEVEQRERLEKLSEDLQAANERLKALDKLKSEFLSFASHQIKSPMAVVKGLASLIYDGSYGIASEEVKKAAGRIKWAVDHLLALVGNFLDLRKIEEGRIEYDFQEINITKMVKDIMGNLKLIAQEKGLELSLRCSAEDIKVKADEEKLRQVVQNLVDNAIKYTKEGFVKVTVDYGYDKGHVLIAVRDSGRGISQELLPNLFKQFSRGSSIAKEIRGTGLGLYIASQIIKAHGGAIWAQSDGEGKGSTFFVRL